RRRPLLLRIALTALGIAVAAAVAIGIVVSWIQRDLDAIARKIDARFFDGLAAENEDSLRTEVDQLLRRDALLPNERQRLRAIGAMLETSARPEAQRAGGRALLRAGAFAAALERLDDCARLDAAARTDAAVAWHCVHTLLPACIGAPPWFALAD